MSNPNGIHRPTHFVAAAAGFQERQPFCLLDYPEIEQKQRQVQGRYPVCDQEAAQGQHRNISAGEGKSQTSCLPRQRILRGIKRRIAELACQQKNTNKKDLTKNETNQRRYSSFGDNSRKNAAENLLFFQAVRIVSANHANFCRAIPVPVRSSGWSVSDAFCPPTAYYQSTFLRRVFSFLQTC